MLWCVVVLCIALQASAEGPVGGCSNKTLWSDVLHDYLTMTEADHRAHIVEWYSFCESVSNGTVMTAPELKLLWSNYTTFLPLDQCKKKQSPNVSNTADTNLLGRVCIDLTFVAVIVSLLVAYALRKCRNEDNAGRPDEPRVHSVIRA